MLDAFRMGGWGMAPTALFGLLLLAASIRYLVSPDRRFIPLQLSLGIMTIASGALGFVTGVMRSLSHIGEVAPDKRWIWAYGVSESMNNLALALALITLAAVAASVGAYRFSQLRPSQVAA